MLKIGFTAKYYTLWDVSSSISYITGDGGMQFPYEKGTYSYLQNLSTDLESAIEKAKSMGCTWLEVDEELFGRNQRFSFERKLYCDLNASNASWFWFGKYKDAAIALCDDINYLTWYVDASKSKSDVCNPIVLKQLDNLGYCKFGNEWVLKTDWIECVTKAEIAADFSKHVRETGSLQCTLTKNLDWEGVASVEVKGAFFQLIFADFVQMEYNGYGYALPKLGGKGKRVKGKELKLNVVHDHDNYYKVSRFEILA
mgnify:FL=1